MQKSSKSTVLVDAFRDKKYPWPPAGGRSPFFWRNKNRNRISTANISQPWISIGYASLCCMPTQRRQFMPN